VKSIVDFRLSFRKAENFEDQKKALPTPDQGANLASKKGLRDYDPRPDLGSRWLGRRHLLGG
jgi:hypothetical protein